MRPRLFLFIFALFASIGPPGFASTFSDAAERLDGQWHGENFVLRVDAKRAQASIDAERPFDWQRFLVKEVTSTEVVFSIGSELYEATISDDDTLTLTGTTFRGERVLHRAPKAGEESSE